MYVYLYVGTHTKPAEWNDTARRVAYVCSTPNESMKHHKLVIRSEYSDLIVCGLKLIKTRKKSIGDINYS